MADPAEPENRDEQGRFRTGVSGNPGGRPRRLRELDAAIAKTHDTARVLRVLDKLSELAVAGNVQAARAYLDRVVGPVRPDDDDRRFEERVRERIRELLEEARAHHRAEERNATAYAKPAQMNGIENHEPDARSGDPTTAV